MSTDNIWFLKRAKMLVTIQNKDMAFGYIIYDFDLDAQIMMVEFSKICLKSFLPYNML